MSRSHGVISLTPGFISAAVPLLPKPAASRLLHSCDTPLYHKSVLSTERCQISATARPLRPATIGRIIPVLANQQQIAQHLGSTGTILDRCFRAFLVTMVLTLIRGFLTTPLYHILAVLSLTSPLLTPIFHATRRNASIRRHMHTTLISGALFVTQTHTRSGKRVMKVAVRSVESGSVARVVVPFDAHVIEAVENAHEGELRAHALTVGGGVGDTERVVEVFVPRLRRFLGGYCYVRRKGFEEICAVVDDEDGW